MTATGRSFSMASLQYNGHSTNQDICSFADDLVNTDDTSYTLEAKTRSANRWMRKIWTWIFFSYGGWQYDDGNQQDLPSATDTLTSGKTAYALPSTAITVRGVEVKDASGIWIELSPVNEEQIREIGAVGEFMKTSGIPAYYQLVGNSVKLYPASNWTQSASFKVFFDRGSVSFASTDTTATPGFATEFHDAVPTGMASDYASRKNYPNKADFINDMAMYERNIKKFYAQRYQEMFPPRFTVRDQLSDAI